MTIKKIDPSFALLSIMIIVVAAIRIPNAAGISPLANFTPIGAMGLFGGVYFSKNWKMFLFPMLTLLVSDLAISTFIFKGQYGVLYGGWYWIYAIFILITLMGKFLIKKVNVKNVLLTGIGAALVHWIIADFLVWFGGGTDLRFMLPLSRDWEGLQQCYVQGFPFMRNFMAGTLLYSAVLFGGYELIARSKTFTQFSVK
jgi:hypothetical protein